MILLHYNPAVFENRHHKNSPYLQGRYGLLFIGSKIEKITEMTALPSKSRAVIL